MFLFLFILFVFFCLFFFPEILSCIFFWKSNEGKKHSFNFSLNQTKIKLIFVNQVLHKRGLLLKLKHGRKIVIIP